MTRPYPKRRRPAPVQDDEPRRTVRLDLFTRVEPETETASAAYLLMGWAPGGAPVEVRRFADQEQLDEAVADLRAGVSLDQVLIRRY